MIKVKEFLDENFTSETKSTSELKKNGHYCVMGDWSYNVIKIPIDYINTDYIYSPPKELIHKGILCYCNNETIIINIINNCKYIGFYGYLQTYEHIPRDEPDTNGYYARSTDEEIIRYLKSYMDLLDK